MPSIDEMKFCAEASSAGINSGTFLITQILTLLEKIRSVSFGDATPINIALRHDTTGISTAISSITTVLHDTNHDAEAEALQQVLDKITEKIEFGGLGIDGDNNFLSPTSLEAILFEVEAFWTALNKKDASLATLPVIRNRAPNTRPMTLSQKIFAHHTIGRVPEGGLRPGDVVRVGLDWVLASELSWNHMEKIYQNLGAPGIWRNDRFWLAGDHVVHPRNAHVPQVKAMVASAEKAKRDFKTTDYQGTNYTIMHTEFVRERAEPGMLCIGSDSHTCSAGAVGSLAIGLGTADVTMGLALGETWFKIPESILVEFVGEPMLGISGKDVIMYILQQLKRNTVAGERIVEFTGATQHLSSDARFAICNMCTELGGITGIFVPDKVTNKYISNRKRKSNKTNSVYFQPDKDAEYAGTYTIDLSKIEPSIALYPEPDHVVPVSEQVGMSLDGVFIGACTTTEEELVLGALILRAGLKAGLCPRKGGRRHYVPGSLPIVEKLRSLGLLEVYEEAGFTRGPPGCSMCLGLSSEKASSGETWLSSQNRNFKNRMGNGSFGHLSSAVVCAASSFSMTVTDPAPLLDKLDYGFYDAYRGFSPSRSRSVPRCIEYMEPNLERHVHQSGASTLSSAYSLPAGVTEKKSLGVVRSKVITLGDFIDTDALAPGYTLANCKSDEEFGEHVLEQTYPEFREKVRRGQKIVVAGKAMGVGSSRECAISALIGVGVQIVIARSYAFIYSRNQPSLGLLGITMSDERFYERAKDNVDMTVDVDARRIEVGGQIFPFELSEMEEKMTLNKGIADSYKIYGKSIWQELSGKRDAIAEALSSQEVAPVITDSRLQW